MFSKLNFIVVFKIGFTLCALKILDHQGRELTSYLQKTYIKDLGENNLLNITCKSDNKYDMLQWKIDHTLQLNFNVCKNNPRTTPINYQAFLQPKDRESSLRCESILRNNNYRENVTVNLILAYTSNVTKPYCTTVPNLFCIDEKILVNVWVTVNNKTMQEKVEPDSGTYAYEYDGEFADVTVTCATKVAVGQMMLCGEHLQDQNTKCEFSECQVTSVFASSAIPGKRVVYCYAVVGDSGNTVKLTIDFKLPSRQTQNNYSLKVVDRLQRELIPINKIVNYTYGLDDHTSLLDITCRSADSQNSILTWTITRGSARISCKGQKGATDFRALLQPYDDSTTLTCQVQDYKKILDHITLKLSLNKTSKVPENAFCTSMTNVFCRNQREQEYITVMVNNQTLQKKGKYDSGAYIYEYESESPDVTVFCSTTHLVDEMILCGKDITDMSTACRGRDKLCQVSKSFYSTIYSKRVVHCYAFNRGLIEGKVVKLTLNYVRVIGLPTTQPPQIDNVNNCKDYRTSATSHNDIEVHILVAVVIILAIIVVALLVFVAYLYTRKITGEQAPSNSATFVQNNRMIELTLENNYYMGAGEIAGRGEAEPTYAVYETPLVAENRINQSSPPRKTETYANYNGSHNLYGNTN